MNDFMTMYEVEHKKRLKAENDLKILLDAFEVLAMCVQDNNSVYYVGLNVINDKKEYHKINKAINNFNINVEVVNYGQNKKKTNS